MSRRVHRSEAEALLLKLIHDAWDAVDPPGAGVDAALLSKDEIRAITRRDPEVGALLARVAEALRASASTIDASMIEAVRTALSSYDLSERQLDAILPDATALDARVGQPGRDGLPETVKSSFDAFYRLEAHDIGSARLYRAKVAGEALTLVYATTDGDESWMEALTVAGSPVSSGRWYAGRLVAWDEFFGRGRLDPIPLEVGRYTREEGLSEPADRAAAGQVPRAWTGDLTIHSGTLTPSLGRLGTVEVDVALTDAQREIAWAGLSLVWERVLRFRLDGAPLRLGLPREQGELQIGTFTRPTDGRTYEIAWWHDIDDSSFVFYFRRDPEGLALAVEQFDN